MTDEQKQMALAFSKVVFQVGSYDKRFCQTMLGYAKDCPERELTERQAILLVEKYHRYRKQIKNHRLLCKVCREAE